MTKIYTDEEIRAKAKEIENRYKKAVQREYMKKYRAKHRKELNLYHREYMKAHPGKAKEYQDRYWNKKALEALAEMDRGTDKVIPIPKDPVS